MILNILCNQVMISGSVGRNPDVEGKKQRLALIQEFYKDYRYHLPSGDLHENVPLVCSRNSRGIIPIQISDVRNPQAGATNVLSTSTISGCLYLKNTDINLQPVSEGLNFRDAVN